MGNTILICAVCKKEFLVPLFRRNTARFCSRSCLGKSRIGEKNSCWRGGLPKCLKCKKTLSARTARYCNLHKGLGQIGDRNHSWKGGITKDRRNIKSPKYKLWIKKVFERDDYTCQKCNKRGCVLQAHHIKSWANYPKLRFLVSNGLTLCVECHKSTENYKGKNNNGKL